MNLKLQGRIALVTGAGAGIGAAISRQLIEEGCTVYIADLNADAARDTAHALGTNAHPFCMDVAHPGQVQDCVNDIVAHRKRLDILVNNAGILKTSSLLDATIDDWDEICKANLSSVYYCSKAVLPIMVKQRHGKIINIASNSAVKGGGVFGNALYATTKAAVISFTKGFARELAPYAINVNAVAPGLVETSMTKKRLTPEVHGQLLAAAPMGRLADVADIANAVAFLASDAAAYITGDTLLVDGGFVIK